MTYVGWHLKSIKLTGNGDKKAKLDFADGLSLVYGASNTGKSFALKALDFMLGGQRELPDIKERRPYDKLWLDIAFSQEHRVQLERAIVGGAFKLHKDDEVTRTLAPKHNPKSPNNISTYLLTQMEAASRKISVDVSGTHNNLSFRDFSGLILTNEIAIQSEISPIESGDTNTKTRERSVFKFVLTGEDDSAIIPVVKPKDFRTGRAAKSSFLQDMIDEIDADLSADFPDTAGLAAQSDKINDTLLKIQNEISFARSSIRTLLDQKRDLSQQISISEHRSTEISLSLDSFEQLEDVYASDITRLESLEEAGFLLTLDGQKDCQVCGAPPDAQVHSYSLTSIENMRVASEAEIKKLKLQSSELVKTVENTKEESKKLNAHVADLRKSLINIERQLEEATPETVAQQRLLSEILSVRDHVHRGLDLIKRREEFIKQKEEIEKSKPPKIDGTVQRGLSTEIAKEFADTVAEVLSAWGFPGNKDVTFDLATYDLIIDGKERRNNGKGVRAITHAAFKVALMLYCRKRGLPHPGFLVLDTPLLTYRDPMKQIDDRLSADEEELSKSDLKQRFFEHLGQLGKDAQIVIFENVDPPEGVSAYCKVETFTNDPEQDRQGFL